MGISTPDRHFPIPVKLSVQAINRSGNNAHKETYIEWEKRRAMLVDKISKLSSHSKALIKLDKALTKMVFL
jgi:hypothetical protein